MKYNETEIRCIRILAQWFEDGRDMMNKPEALKAFAISEPEYSRLMRKLELCGAFDHVLGGQSPREFALDFIPGPGCVEILHEIETQQQQSQVPPDIVDQFKQRLHRNPKTAIIVIIVVVLAILLPLLNSGIELIQKLITLFSK
ncbi:MAG: hypothetical protein DRP66_05625 [Planctomycetota bacterium]|nr:MAG: hypothetical protein DRP66_05625 [Planctomycetota bacterium]